MYWHNRPTLYGVRSSSTRFRRNSGTSWLPLYLTTFKYDSELSHFLYVRILVHYNVAFDVLLNQWAQNYLFIRYTRMWRVLRCTESKIVLWHINKSIATIKSPWESSENGRADSKQQHSSSRKQILVLLFLNWWWFLVGGWSCRSICHAIRLLGIGENSLLALYFFNEEDQDEDNDETLQRQHQIKINFSGQCEDVTLYVEGWKKPPRLFHPTVGCKIASYHLFRVFAVE